MDSNPPTDCYVSLGQLCNTVEGQERKSEKPAIGHGT